MLLHHCPARTRLGLSNGHRSCTMCDTQHPDALEGSNLRDEKGHSFPLLRQRLPEGCLVRLMNTLPTDLLDRVSFAPRLIELTDETDDVCRRIRREYEGGGKIENTTSGHWMRPVE